MIHKMYALYDLFGVDFVESMNNQYGLVNDDEEHIVIVQNIELKNNIASLGRIEMLQYNKQMNLRNFFYKKAPGQRKSPFPTIVVTLDSLSHESNGKNEFESKFSRKISAILSGNCKINKELKPILNLHQNEISIISDTLKETISIKPKDKYLYTIKINGFYTGESEYYNGIKKNSIENLYSGYYHLSESKEIQGKDFTCSICRSNSKTAWGYVSTFNFYTSKTDHQPIAGGFMKERAHYNYPVCPECAEKLYKMKPLIENYFNYRFCGLNYFLIPEFISVSLNKNYIKDILELFVTDNREETKIGKLSLGKNRSIVEDDTEDIFESLSESKNIANYTMLFYQQNNQEFKILSTLEGIFPSQFEKIFTTKDIVESYEVFHKLKGLKKDAIDNHKFTFNGIVKAFFPINSKMEGDFTKAFLEISRAIFMQSTIEYNYILDRIVKVIRKQFINEQYWSIYTLKGLMLLHFLIELGSINKEKPKFKEVNLNKKYCDFFTEHSSVFGTNSAKAVFLIGVLCQFLLNIQQRERSCTPFRKKLNSLKLNPELITKLYPQIIEKLEQYDSNYYKELETDISSLLITESLDVLNNNEISFYFVLGMTLSKKLKIDKNEKGDNND